MHDQHAIHCADSLDHMLRHALIGHVDLTTIEVLEPLACQKCRSLHTQLPLTLFDPDVCMQHAVHRCGQQACMVSDGVFERSSASPGAHADVRVSPLLHHPAVTPAHDPGREGKCTLPSRLLGIQGPSYQQQRRPPACVLDQCQRRTPSDLQMDASVRMLGASCFKLRTTSFVISK